MGGLDLEAATPPGHSTLPLQLNSFKMSMREMCTCLWLGQVIAVNNF